VHVDKLTMKENLLLTVDKLKEGGINISETPPLFKWSYPEEPAVEFQLLITLVKGKQIH